jgi:S1-C subfamily serine protease
MRRTLTLITVVLLALGACSIRDLPGVADKIGAPDETVPSVDLQQNAPAAPHSELSQIVEQTLASVVHVKVRAVDLQAGLEGRGEGSGVVIDRNGIILTNNHVISGAIDVRVLFNDDHKPMEGRVIGADPARDLAVIKVDASDLNAIPIGHSDGMKLGDDVVAIGFPLGLGGPTVTKGIISGDGRAITAQSAGGEVERLVGMLQTDAAINPGNSGGALIDMNGSLIGINTAVAGSAENVGFAIAIDQALPIVEEFLNTPPEKQSWLGISMQTLTQTLAEQIGYPSDLRGVLIVQVIPGSPAEGANIADGTVVTAIDGTAVTTDTQLAGILSDHQPGDRVTLELFTPNGETKSVAVELAVRPFTFTRPSPTPTS